MLTSSLTFSNVLTPKLGKSLHQLDLSYNQFVKSKGFFDELVNLKKLVLDGNKHLEMNNDDFFGTSLKNLEELSLDGCGLKSINDKIFDNVPYVVFSRIYELLGI